MQPLSESCAAQAGQQQTLPQKTARLRVMRLQRFFLLIRCLALSVTALLFITLPNYFLRFASARSAGERPWRPTMRQNLHLTSWLHGGGCLDNNSHRRIPGRSRPTSYLLKAGESHGDRFIESPAVTSVGVLNARISFTATVHVRRTTDESVSYSPFVRYCGTNSPAEIGRAKFVLSSTISILESGIFCLYKISSSCLLADTSNLVPRENPRRRGKHLRPYRFYLGTPHKAPLALICHPSNLYSTLEGHHRSEILARTRQRFRKLGQIVQLAE